MTTFLTVTEFAAQVEVDKHPSQIYGWMKKGLPFEVQDGKKVIPFDAGLAWLQSRPTRRKGAGVTGTVVDGIPTVTKRKEFDVQPGTWLRWERGLDLGAAFALVVPCKSETLVKLYVEYRPAPVYYPKDKLEEDLETKAVVIVYDTAVFTFLLDELSRLDFLLRLVRGPEIADKLWKHVFGVLPAGFVERMQGEGRRSYRHWPLKVSEPPEEENDNGN